MQIKVGAAAAAAVVLVLLGAVLTEFGKALLRRFVEWVLALVFRQRFPGRFARSRYRKAIRHQDFGHSLGFLRTLSVNVDDVYVPLRGELNGAELDLGAVVQGRLRVVILGSAGAGSRCSCGTGSSAGLEVRSGTAGSRLWSSCTCTTARCSGSSAIVWAAACGSTGP